MSSIVECGAGNKILAAVEVACNIQYRIGGLLNFYAPKTVLKSIDEKMMDLFGKEIRICEHKHGHGKDLYAVKWLFNDRGYLLFGVAAWFGRCFS